MWWLNRHMIEQTEVPMGPGVSAGAPKLALSEEVRASLQAVRVAQEAAHARSRKASMQARIWFATAVAALALAAFAVGPRVTRWRHGRVHAVTPRPTALVPEATTSPAQPMRVATAAPIAKAPAPSMPAPTPPEVSAPALAPAEAPAKARHGGADDAVCDPALIKSAPWRLDPEACARAFDANPTDARLALAIGHAEHVRGHFAEAAQWATRALALDPKAAESYVLIARAHAANGQQAEARTAYRQYLDLAPRGWHKKEAKAALEAAPASAR
jgi:tetratricopeptide (TPR) repeat protein